MRDNKISPQATGYAAHPQEKRDRALALKAGGWGKKRIASEIGVDARTVGRWLSDAAEISGERAEVQERVIQTIADAQTAAVRKILELVDHPDPKIALRACEVILRHTVAPPVQRVEVVGDALGEARRLTAEGDAATVLDVDDA